MQKPQPQEGSCPSFRWTDQPKAALLIASQAKLDVVDCPNSAEVTLHIEYLAVSSAGALHLISYLETEYSRFAWSILDRN